MSGKYFGAFERQLFTATLQPLPSTGRSKDPHYFNRPNGCAAQQASCAAQPASLAAAVSKMPQNQAARRRSSGAAPGGARSLACPAGEPARLQARLHAARASCLRHATPHQPVPHTCCVQRTEALPGFPDLEVDKPTGVLECSNANKQWR